MHMNAAKNAKKLAGGSINWNQLLIGVNGNIKAKPTTPKLLRSKGILGLLL